MKLSFRNIVLIAVQAFVLAAVAHGQAQPITITAPQAEVKADAPVLLHIVLANLSRQNIWFFRAIGMGHAELFYTISVSDSDGIARPVTSYGDAILNKGARPVSRITVTLKPGEKLEEDATISDMFDMKSPGTYKVIVKRRSPLDPDVILRSNAISITVTH